MIDILTPDIQQVWNSKMGQNFGQATRAIRSLKTPLSTEDEDWSPFTPQQLQRLTVQAGKKIDRIVKVDPLI